MKNDKRQLINLDVSFEEMEVAWEHVKRSRRTEVKRSACAKDLWLSTSHAEVSFAFGGEVEGRKVRTEEGVFLLQTKDRSFTPPIRIPGHG